MRLFNELLPASLGSEIRKLRNREVRLVKVKRGEGESKATWETEVKMRSLYPFL